MIIPQETALERTVGAEVPVELQRQLPVFPEAMACFHTGIGAQIDHVEHHAAQQLRPALVAQRPAQAEEDVVVEEAQPISARRLGAERIPRRMSPAPLTAPA